MILKNITIVDFTRLLPGPLASKWLADAGANVLKIEDVNRQDGIKAYSAGPYKNAALFEALNAKKELHNKWELDSLAGNPSFVEMLSSADVLIEQFKPGLMDKLGLGFEAVKKINPSIIYISLSGFGADRAEPGHDLNFVAESGLLDLLRDENGKPVIPRFQLGDISGSYACYAAVLEALIERMQTGTAVYKHVNMLAAVLPFGVIPHRFLEAGFAPMADFLAGAIPNYNVYACADGEYIALAALEAHLWKNVVSALQIPEGLQDAINNPSKVAEMSDFFAQKTAAEWLSLAQGKNCCLSPVAKPGSAIFNAINANRLECFQTEDGEQAKTFKSPFA